MPDLSERDGKFACPSAKCGSKVHGPSPLSSLSLPPLAAARCLLCARSRVIAGLQIGSWDWAGSQCSCGQWIAPAMQFPMSKVMLLMRGQQTRRLSVSHVTYVLLQVDVKGVPWPQRAEAAAGDAAGDCRQLQAAGAADGCSAPLAQASSGGDLTAAARADASVP